jgi:hypothetical protein
MTISITFVVPVNDEIIFAKNFMASPCLGPENAHQVLIQRGFKSAATAYNDAIARSANDLMVFAHSDILFPSSWLFDLERALRQLEVSDPNWGVLGCYGETLSDNGRGYVYSPGRGILGNVFDQPAAVQTLDEIVLIIRKSSGLRFDQELPHFHFYGADICMAAADIGRRSYAICALCIHNTQQNLVLPREFYESYQRVKHRWRKFLPIQTTCARITRFDLHMYKRRLQEAYLRNIRRKEVGHGRKEDGRQVLAELERLYPNTRALHAGIGRLCQ